MKIVNKIPPKGTKMVSQTAEIPREAHIPTELPQHTKAEPRHQLWTWSCSEMFNEKI